MQKLSWKPDFETGIADIDDDHAQLFGIYNDIVELTQTNSSPEKVCDAIRQLFHRARKHFCREEEILGAFGCPMDALEQHRFEHQVHLDDLEMLINWANQEPNHRFGSETFDFLSDWLTQHALGSDKEIIALFHDTKTGIGEKVFV